MSSKKKKKQAHNDIESIEDTIRENVFKQPKLHIKDVKLTEKQKEFVKIAFDKNTKIIFVNAPAGVGKAQPLDADILGENGWIKMGDIKSGDKIYGEDGMLHNVLSVYPQGIKDVYKISFSDGSSTECCLDHLWLTRADKDRNVRKRKREGGKSRSIKQPQLCGSVKSTKQILDSLFVRNGSRINHSIPITKPINFSKQNHYIDPYVLGVLLGDGSFRKKPVVLTSIEPEIVKYVSEHLPKDITLKRISSSEICYSLINNNRKETRSNPFTQEIENFGLNGLFSYEKYIPKNYLFDSIENRIELLRGLLDTDGSVNKTGSSVVFYTTSNLLMLDVKFLVESLGGTCLIRKRLPTFTYKGIKKLGKLCYTLCIKLPPEINPFKLSRKRDLVVPKTKYKPIRYIKNIELIGNKPCQCILVDNPSHLYITNDFIVTHNTFLSVYCALHMLNANPKLEIKYIRTIAESGDRGLGSLPGTVNEKFDPFMMPLRDKLDELLPISEAKKLEEEGVIEALPVNYLRGASWRDKVIVADECFEDTVYVETDKGRVRLSNILKNPGNYKALSFDENSKEFVYKRITNTFEKGEQLISRLILDNKAKIRATKNHSFLTINGWKKIEEMAVGDEIISSSDSKHAKLALNDHQKDIVIGSILGDGSIYFHSNNSARMSCIHGIKQKDYASFKASCFLAKETYIEKNGFSQKPAVRFYTRSFSFSKCNLYDYAIENLNLRSLAIAWQDDGCMASNNKIGQLWSCAVSESSTDKLVLKLNSMGFDCVKEIQKKKEKVYFTICFRMDGFDKMVKSIAPYIHPSMAYKIPEKYHHLIDINSWNCRYLPYSIRVVTKIELDIDKQKTWDIEVEDTHNFVVSLCRTGDGTKIVAHNCQNFSLKEAVTMLTRIGENTKMFICGDSMQSDIGGRSGFMKLFQTFDTDDSKEKGIHCFQFNEEDIMRSEILKFIVKKISGITPVNV